MGDMGDIWRETKEARELDSRRRRDRNREHAKQRLNDEDIKYTSHNNDNHWKINIKHLIIDYWPTTGKWISQTRGQGRGIKSLINHIQSQTQRG